MRTQVAEKMNGKHPPPPAGSSKKRHSSIGLEPPPKAWGWSVSRQEHGKNLRCFWHANGQKLGMLPLAEIRPTVEGIAEMWGSGSYIVTWYAENGTVLGRARTLGIDDPGRPAKALYPNAPTAAAAPAAAPQPPPNPFAAQLAALQSGNPIAMMMMLMQMQQQSDDRAHQRAQRELELSLARDREFAALQMGLIRDHYRTTLETVRAARAPAPVERDDDDDDDDVHDRIDELAEHVATLAKRAEDGGEQDPIKAAVVGMLKSIPPDALAALGSSVAKRIAGG